MIIDLTIWGIQMIEGDKLQSALLFAALIASLAVSSAVGRAIEGKLPQACRKWARLCIGFAGLVASFVVVMSLLYYLVIAYMLGVSH